MKSLGGGVSRAVFSTRECVRSRENEAHNEQQIGCGNCQLENEVGKLETFLPGTLTHRVL